MRLLFVNERLDYASATSYTMDLALALRERGDEVRLCACSGDLLPAFRARGIQTYRVKYNILSFWKLVEFLREYNPQLIHIQSLDSLRLGQRLATRLRKPYVVTAHRRPGYESDPIEGRYYRGVIALNEIIREALVNDQALPKSSVRVIRRGVHFPRPKSEDLEASASRIPVIGSIGRLVTDKGHHFLIEAARILLDRGVEAHFAIVGEGSEESRLRALVRELGLAFHVTFSPHLPRRTELFALFDIVALPVLSSGVGVTALEAMAMGKPLIASTAGEHLHIIQDGETGCLVPVGDPAALADCLERVIGDIELRRRLSVNARRWVEKEFALEPMVRDTREFYGAVLEDIDAELRLAAR